MAGIPISNYLDWVVNTGPQFLSGDNYIVNSVSRRSFILGKFLRGKPASEILQGSNKIQETLYLSAIRTYQTFQRGDDITWSNPQKDVVMSLDFKFTLDHMSWDEWEYEGQTAGMSGDGLKAKYKDMAYSKQQRLWESNVDGLEDSLWKPPATSNADTQTYADMETGGPELYSIPVFVNENDLGTSATGSFSDAWVNVEGVSWSTYQNNWDNARQTYDATDPADTDGDSDGLFNAFDKMMIQTNYRRPGTKDRYFEDEVDPGNELIICSSLNGCAQIIDLHRRSNDSLIQPQDAAYPYPRWNGAAIVDVQGLDTAALYKPSSGTALVTEEAATVSRSGPRYYWLNTRYMKMVFHRAKYFEMGAAKEPERKVGQYVIPVESWCNMTCTSRRHQGLISPQ